jgi:hypothetical protein
MTTDRTLALAARAAEKLEYTTGSLEEIAEADEEIAEVVDSKEFLEHFDSMIFCCTRCHWWKRQRENATPDAAEWVCQECISEA